jgi:transcriptional regulator with XRE-family HTH domain
MELKLRQIRKKCGLTMKELGERVGVAESTISQYETGKRQPDYETLLKIADYFGVSVDEILGKQRETEDQELEEYLEQLKNRPEMKMLFKLAANATKEDVEQAVRIIEAIRKK